ncbi:hypothetical protein [Roseobacter sp. OBYS 0001]|uniref:hypothetical protein n=1 Tax=Roseobacter sp. OBYS 0001 TaxID=882651 RepID=UPI001BC5FD13|nr:hypothetical protein [Roseobacter sp. OBYS 0001]GIT85425.1 hypothetical protein ROBYS_04410 [Roseobacter sp. OBYS 0001]
MSMALVSLAAQIGAPMVRKLLSDRIGSGNAKLAEEVAGAIAERVGVAPDQLEGFAAKEPEVVMSAIKEVEAMTPNMMQVALAETQTREALLLAETARGGWQAAWRPAGMYLIGFFWLWNMVILHIANAVFKIALPPTDFAILLQISAAYMALYMGGHTAKDVFRNRKGAR